MKIDFEALLAINHIEYQLPSFTASIKEDSR